MSDIRRWHLQGLPGTTGIVDVMPYADHVAAVAAAENDVALYAFNRALDKAAEAVAALRHPLCQPFEPSDHDLERCGCLLLWRHVDAAIAALKGEQR